MRMTTMCLPGLLAALLLCGCNAGPVAAHTTPPQTRQLIVLIDLSASHSPAMDDDARKFLHEMVSQLSYGDQLVLLQMQGSGLTDPPRRWRADLPIQRNPDVASTRDKGYLKAGQTGMIAAVDSFLKSDSAAKSQHTDILTTLQLAGEQMRDSEGRSSTVLILSDMLQSAQGIEMDRLARMPRPDWIAKRKSLGLIPNLAGACVFVVGADATDVAGAKVKSFWERYFDAAGTPLLEARYRALPPRADRNLCT